MSSKWIPKSCVLWELGWVEERIGLWSLVPSLGMVADHITTLTRLWKEVTIVAPTGLCLSFFLPVGLEVSLPAKEKGANHRQRCFPLQQQFWSCLVGRLEVYGRHVWWSRPRGWAGFCRFIFCSGIREAVDIQAVWMLWLVWISGTWVQPARSIARSAEQTSLWLLCVLPAVTYLKGRAVFFSGFLALQM